MKKTIQVQPWGKDQGDFVLINEEDFNPEFHKLLDEVPVAPKPSKGLNVEQIKAKLTEKGITFSEDAKKPELAKLLDEVPAE